MNNMSSKDGGKKKANNKAKRVKPRRFRKGRKKRNAPLFNHLHIGYKKLSGSVPSGGLPFPRSQLVSEDGEGHSEQPSTNSLPKDQKVRRYELVKKKKNACRRKKFKYKSTIAHFSDKIVDLESEERTSQRCPSDDGSTQDDDCILVEKHLSVIIIDDENPGNNVLVKTDEDSEKPNCEYNYGQCLGCESSEKKINENKPDVAQIPDIPLDNFGTAETGDKIFDAKSQISDTSSDEVEIVIEDDQVCALWADSDLGSIINSPISKKSKSTQGTSSYPLENKENQNFYEDHKSGLGGSLVPLYNEVKTDKSKRSRRQRKRKRKSADDSVVFLSEEIDLDKFSPMKRTFISEAPQFISLTRSEINDRDSAEKTQSSLSNLSHVFGSTPLPREGSEVLMGSQKKPNEQYSSNTYNPTKKQLNPGKRMIIIDASNVAFAHSLKKEFSVKGLEISLTYFERMGHEVKAVLPLNRTNPGKSTDPKKLLELHRAGKIVFTPCKNLPGLTSTSYDDRFILQLAVEFDAAVISNDNYRDLLKESPAFKNIIENRVIGYTWCNDVFILPKDPYGRLGPSLNVILNRI